jgi:hypothetical protein
MRTALDAAPNTLILNTLGRPERRGHRAGDGFANRRDVSQRNVEIAIGRLVTDEAFREMFIRDPASALAQFIESGYELTPLEVSAVESTDRGLWTRTAEQIDPRLQKVSLKVL